jgi:hypothetical protein
MRPEMRTQIADTLKRHPRFAEDFAPEMPAEDTDRWIFWQAGFWPDIARDIPEDVRPQFNHPTWHYVNHALFLGPVRRVNLNLSTILAGPRENWNLYQSTQHNLDVLRSDAPPQEKALAYCWVCHLVGDMHLPLHCVTLVCDRFPTGDKGGSILKVLSEKDELHGLWDCLLGDDHDRTAVLAAYQKLKANPELWNVDTSGNFKDWMLESRELAESLTYSPEILAAIEQSRDNAPIPLSEDYLKRAGAAARARVVAAGLRLAAVLEQSSARKTGRMGSGT